jgi:hypothetical protein
MHSVGVDMHRKINQLWVLWLSMCGTQHTCLKMAVFWVFAPCSLVQVYRRFRGAIPDDGGSKHLLNVDKLLPDYTAQQPRSQPPSYLPP